MASAKARKIVKSPESYAILYRQGPHTLPRPLSEAWVRGMQRDAESWPPQICHSLYHEFHGAPSHGSQESRPQVGKHLGTVAINAITPRWILLLSSGVPRAAKNSPGKEGDPGLDML